MKSSLKALLTALAFASLTLIFGFGKIKQVEDDRFIACTVDCKKQNVAMYWKDDQGGNFGSLGT